MRALRIADGNLTIADVPKPQPGAGEALVRIRAAGLNRADVLQLQGRYAVPPGAPADIPGLEFAGVVEAIGDGAVRVAVGQRVFGLCGGGAHAEYITSSQDLLMTPPGALSDVDAAAIPEVYITAHDALLTQAALQRGESVLVHAIGSGVGIAALQIAKTLGCRVFGTSRDDAKLERVMSLGVDGAFNPAATAFDEAILAQTDGKGVAVILDPVGAAYFARNLNALAQCGRLVSIATLGGTTATLPLDVLMRKRLRLFGTMLRSRSLDEKIAATRAFEHDLLLAFASNELKVLVDRVFPLEKATEAYDYMAADRNFGKIVLTM